MQNVGMNVSQFTTSMYNMVNQQVQGAGMQQLTQLTSMFSQADTMMGGMVSSYQALMGQSFSQMPNTGFIPSPGPEMQFPANPPLAEGAQPGDGKTGLIQTAKEPPAFVTPGGFTVEAEGTSAGWKITTPEGKSTRIWGDPHVAESDAGKWDFKKGMSFVLPDGTKITCKTTPPGKNGYTVTEGIDIMNGNEMATIGGIDKNQPKSEGVQTDRWAADARVPDGDYAVLGGDGDDWFLHGKGEIVGSSQQGAVLHTKQGPGEGITDKAQAAMQEAPSFGSQDFMKGISQQLLQRMLSPMPFQQFGGASPFNPGGMTGPTGPQPGMGGWGTPPGVGTENMNPGVGSMMGQIMETMQNMFDMMKDLTGMLGDLMKNVQFGQQGAPQVAPEAGPTGVPDKMEQLATQKFDKILEAFHQDAVTSPKGGMDKADDMIRDLVQDPALMKAMNPEQKGRLLNILAQQTELKHGGNQTAALDILRGAKDPAEFRQLLDDAGGIGAMDKMMWDVDQGSFNFLLEKNDVPRPPGGVKGMFDHQGIISLLAARQ